MSNSIKNGLHLIQKAVNFCLIQLQRRYKSKLIHTEYVIGIDLGNLIAKCADLLSTRLTVYMRNLLTF